MVRRVAVVLVALVAAMLLGSWTPARTSGHEPSSRPELATRPGHVLGKSQVVSAGAETAAAALPSGFQEQILFSGLTHPTVIQFAPDGRVFIAEKSGLIKVFDDLTDTTPTIFADLSAQVDDYWDRGLLGLALPPNFPTNTYVCTSCTRTTLPSAGRRPSGMTPVRTRPDPRRTGAS